MVTVNMYRKFHEVWTCGFLDLQAVGDIDTEICRLQFGVLLVTSMHILTMFNKRYAVDIDLM